MHNTKRITNHTYRVISFLIIIAVTLSLITPLSPENPTVYADNNIEDKTENDKYDINELDILPIDNQQYTGNPITPNPTIMNNTSTLAIDTDYTLAWADNITAGQQAKVIITGAGDYEGTTTVSFTIEPKNLYNCTIGQIQDQVYNGEIMEPDIAITDGAHTLIKNIDYTISYYDNINAGFASATVKGIGNYKGEEKSSFVINKAPQTINVTPLYKKTLGEKWFTLDAGIAKGGNKLTYASSNKKVAQVSAAGNVSLTGPGKARITITAQETENYEQTVVTSIITVKPAKIAGVKLKAKKGKKITVSWSKNSLYTGYEMLLTTDKKFVKNVKTIYIEKGSKSKITIPKLKKKKTYYVKIRAYKVIDGVKVYGSYSTSKKVKTRK